MAGDDASEVRVSISALVIAIIALLVATLQIAQAIFATARGLPNCSSKVMGGWSKGTRKRFIWSQLRMEVNFEAPIIFLAPPNNKNYPETSEVSVVEGTEESCAKNHVDWQSISSDQSDERAKRVHTINNETATWVHLLFAVESMETDSKSWELDELRQEGLPANIQPRLPEPTLAVKVQAKTRSFDVNLAIKKPYATTTISHMVELAAVLGLYWKVFSRDDDRYRAEGNGYSLTGSRIADLGISFVFEKTGNTVFGERRVIPTSEVKELCFGRVPTLFRSKKNADEDVEWQRELRTSSGTGIKVKILQMGSADEIAETLTHIGCNGITTRSYANGMENRHLFPVTFEVLGMLARVLHMKGRCFRFLPNPTISPWDKESFSLPRLLDAFSGFITNDLAMIENEVEAIADESANKEVLSAVENVRTLSGTAKDLHEAFKQDSKLTCDRMTDLHKAIELADETLRAREQGIVLDVLRRHLEEVLAAINKSSAGEKGNVSFQDLLDIPLEMREGRFMETYFGSILWRVVPTNKAENSKRDEEVVSQEIHEESEKRRSRLGNGQPQARSAALAASPETSPIEATRGTYAESTPTPGISKRGTWPHREPEHSDQPMPPKLDKIAEQPDWATTVTKHVEMQRVAVWYTLVFRMICWLMLHDFDKKDKQVSKSELIGNRQPVFIL